MNEEPVSIGAIYTVGLDRDHPEWKTVEIKTVAAAVYPYVTFDTIDVKDVSSVDSLPLFDLLFWKPAENATDPQTIALAEEKMSNSRGAIVVGPFTTRQRRITFLETAKTALENEQNVSIALIRFNDPVQDFIVISRSGLSPPVIRPTSTFVPRLFASVKLEKVSRHQKERIEKLLDVTAKQMKTSTLGQADAVYNTNDLDCRMDALAVCLAHTAAFTAVLQECGLNIIHPDATSTDVFYTQLRTVMRESLTINDIFTFIGNQLANQAQPPGLPLVLDGKYVTNFLPLTAWNVISTPTIKLAEGTEINPDKITWRLYNNQITMEAFGLQWNIDNVRQNNPKWTSELNLDAIKADLGNNSHRLWTNAWYDREMPPSDYRVLLSHYNWNQYGNPFSPPTFNHILQSYELVYTYTPPQQDTSTSVSLSIPDDAAYLLWDEHSAETRGSDNATAVSYVNIARDIFRATTQSECTCILCDHTTLEIDETYQFDLQGEDSRPKFEGLFEKHRLSYEARHCTMCNENTTHEIFTNVVRSPLVLMCTVAGKVELDLDFYLECKNSDEAYELYAIVRNFNEENCKTFYRYMTSPKEWFSHSKGNDRKSEGAYTNIKSQHEQSDSLLLLYQRKTVPYEPDFTLVALKSSTAPTVTQRLRQSYTDLKNFLGTDEAYSNASVIEQYTDLATESVSNFIRNARSLVSGR